MPIELRTFRPIDTDEVVALWHEAGLVRPWNDPVRDIRRHQGAQPGLFVVAEVQTDGRTHVVGTVMAGFDGHRGWLYYLAVAREHRGTGLGRALVAEAETRLEAVGCPKVQLMVRSENTGVIGLYEELGYEASDVRVLGKRLIADV